MTDDVVRYRARSEALQLTVTLYEDSEHTLRVQVDGGDDDQRLNVARGDVAELVTLLQSAERHTGFDERDQRIIDEIGTAIRRDLKTKAAREQQFVEQMTATIRVDQAPPLAEASCACRSSSSRPWESSSTG